MIKEEQDYITVKCPKCGHEQQISVDAVYEEAEKNDSEECYATCEECGERFCVNEWLDEIRYSLTPKGIFHIAISDAGIANMLDILEEENDGIGRQANVAFDLFEEYMYQNGYIHYDDKPDMNPDNPQSVKDLLRISLEDAGIDFKPRQAEVAYTLFKIYMNRQNYTVKMTDKEQQAGKKTDKVTD